MNEKNLLRTGVIGTLVAAICCFTPALVVALSAIGLSAVLAWLDYVLLPALVIFVALTVYSVFRFRSSQRSQGSTGRTTDPSE